MFNFLKKPLFSNKGTSDSSTGKHSGFVASAQSMMEAEYLRGLQNTETDIILDMSLTESMHYSLCLVNEGIPKTIPMSDVANQLEKHVKKNANKLSILLPVDMCFSKFLRAKSTSRFDIEEEAAKSVSYNLYECESSFIVCAPPEGENEHQKNAEEKTYVFASFFPDEAVKTMEENVLRSPMDMGMTVTCVMDRSLALTRLALEVLQEHGEDCVTTFCVEQSGDSLFLWNSIKLKNGGAIPANFTVMRVPPMQTEKNLIEDIMILEHELYRVQKFPLPDVSVLITDGTPMLSGFFSLENLADVCSKTARSGRTHIRNVHNGAISGFLRMLDDLGRED